jgi:hypothetical protein
MLETLLFSMSKECVVGSGAGVPELVEFGPNDLARPAPGGPEVN